jgi:class 3 adenylate cyclase
MRETVRLTIRERDRIAFAMDLTAIVELGRQRQSEPNPYALLAAAGEEAARLIIASAAAENFSRRHIQLRPLADARVRIRNGSRLPLSLGDASELLAGHEIELLPPFAIKLGTRTVAVTLDDPEEHSRFEQLRDGPPLLEGHDAEVTLLFCDVRDFSRAKEEVGPATAADWLNDVTGKLAQCVIAEGGVLVDHIGGELLAMWGAPRQQSDQATRAARAGLAMGGVRKSLNRDRRETLPGPLNVGIGLNTGISRVGKCGSGRRLKYRPSGNAVNLASRVQGLTRYLRCGLLATAATYGRLGPEFVARRVCRARFVDIGEPIDVFEIEPASSADREAFLLSSESALDFLEGREFALAARQAATLLEEYPDDGPLRLILSRASTMLVNGGNFDPVWEPPGP